MIVRPQHLITFLGWKLKWISHLEFVNASGEVNHTHSFYFGATQPSSCETAPRTHPNGVCVGISRCACAWRGSSRVWVGCLGPEWTPHRRFIPIYSLAREIERSALAGDFFIFLFYQTLFHLFVHLCNATTFFCLC